MTLRKNTQSVMVRQDIAALAMNAVELDTHLATRREQIKELSDKNDHYAKVIDSIRNLAGRASAGHDLECECSYCLIHRAALKAWQNS